MCSVPRFVVEHYTIIGVHSMVWARIAGLTLSLLAFACVLPSAGNANRIVVTSSEGPSEAYSVRTLPEAIRVAAELRSKSKTADITVTLPAGDYRLTTSIILDINVSGNGRFMLKGSDTGVTRILGSFIIPPERIKPATKTDYNGAHTDALSAAKEIEMAAGGGRPVSLLFGTSKNINAFSHPFVQGRTRFTPARWPVSGWVAGARPNGAFSGIGDREFPIQLPASAPLGINRESNVVVSGFWGVDWFFERAAALPVGVDGSVIIVGPVRQNYKPRGHFRYALENIYSALSPGRFVLAKGGSSAVAVPLPGASPMELIETRTLLKIVGGSRISVEAIAFENTTGTAIEIVNSRFVKLSDVYVGNSGGNGINVDRGRNVLIERAVVADAGTNGIVINAGDRTRLSPGNVQVVDSIVTRAGSLMPADHAAIRISGVGNVISGSLLTDLPHAAVWLTGNDHLVEGNEIAFTDKDVDDAGAVYAGRNWTARGNVIRGNYFHNIGYGQSPSKLISAIYLDDGSSGFLIENNIFRTVSRAIFIHGGRDNDIRNNAFLSSDKPAVAIEKALRFTSDEEWNSYGVMRKRLEAMPIHGSLWRGRYPRLQDVLLPGREIPKNNTLIDNVILGVPAVQYRGRLDPSLLPTHLSSIYPADAAFQQAHVNSSLVQLRLSADPRLKGLFLELADRQNKLSRLRFMDMGKVRSMNR